MLFNLQVFRGFPLCFCYWFLLKSIVVILFVIKQNHSSCLFRWSVVVLQCCVNFCCCCCLVSNSCLTLCDPMHCSLPGLPVYHYLLEFAQTCVHWVSDAFQPSHPLLSPSRLAHSLSQHWSFDSSLQVAKALEFQF